MSRFYVGQRVRIKFCYFPVINGDCSGMQGAITEKTVGMLHSEIVDAWKVVIDGLSEFTSRGHPRLFTDSQLEPATDSYDKTEWKDCAWKPDHMREEVLAASLVSIHGPNYDFLWREWP